MHEATADEKAAKREKETKPLLDRRQLIFSLAFCLFMAACAVALNMTGAGEEFGVFVYRLSQSWIQPQNPQSVIVVDISELEMKSGSTPRSALNRLVQTIAEKEPAVIGVDIDFSPEGGRFIDPDDPQFFASCLRLRPLKVYLGVYRSIVQTFPTLPESEWLGLPAFKDLAAALPIKDPPELSLRSLPAGDSGSAAVDEALDVPTLSWALASEFKKSTRWKGKPRTALQFMGDQFLAEKVTADFVPKAFYINYSARDGIKGNAIKLAANDFASADNLRRIMANRSDDIRGKVILIGDLTRARQGDLFAPPTSTERAIPGVLVHACATETLIHTPLYAFPPVPDFIFDVMVSFLLLLIVQMVLRHGGAALNEKKLAFLVYALAAFTVVLFGRLINYTGLFWPDFMLVAIGLIAHPSAHRKAEKVKELVFEWLHK